MSVSKQHITGIILAGGQSSRMGSDKGLMLYKGKPFIAHIMEALQPIVSDIIVVSNSINYNQFHAKCVVDIMKNEGPLGGLYTGLYHSKTALNVVLSCDVPLVTKELLTVLITEVSDDFDIVQVAVHGSTNPLLAIYKKDCMASCLEALKAGERRLRKFVSQQKTKIIRVEPNLEEQTQNINTINQLNQLYDVTKN